MDVGLAFLGGDGLRTVLADRLLDAFPVLPLLDVEGAVGDLGGHTVDQHLVSDVAPVLFGDRNEGLGGADFDLALEVDGGGFGFEHGACLSHSMSSHLIGIPSWIPRQETESVTLILKILPKPKVSFPVSPPALESTIYTGQSLRPTV